MTGTVPAGFSMLPPRLVAAVAKARRENSRQQRQGSEPGSSLAIRRGQIPGLQAVAIGVALVPTVAGQSAKELPPGPMQEHENPAVAPEQEELELGARSGGGGDGVRHDGVRDQPDRLSAPPQAQADVEILHVEVEELAPTAGQPRRRRCGSVWPSRSPRGPLRVRAVGGGGPLAGRCLRPTPPRRGRGSARDCSGGPRLPRSGSAGRPRPLLAAPAGRSRGGRGCRGARRRRC